MVFLNKSILFVFMICFAWNVSSEELEKSVLEGLFKYRIDSQSSYDKKYKINRSLGIDVSESVAIDGIDHYLTIRGRYRDNPVILFIHGGPGFTMMPFAYDALRRWEEEFTVVHWDQRGAGKTYCNNPEYDFKKATFVDYVDDAEAISRFLIDRLQVDKITIIGHSWGSIIGMHLIKRAPELFNAYIGTGQFTDGWEVAKSAYDFSLRSAYSKNDKEAIDILSSLAPYPKNTDYIDDYLTVLSYVLKFGGSIYGGTNYNAYFYSAFFESSIYDLNDWKCWRTINAYVNKKLLNQVFDKRSSFGKISSLGYSFELPIFFFLGDNDEHVSSRLAAAYFNKINAPLKEMYFVQEAAHFVPLEQPDEVLNLMVERVKPLM